MAQGNIHLEDDLRQGEKSYNKIAKIQNECITIGNDTICVDISKARYINPAFLTVLGSLIKVNRDNSSKVFIKIDKENKNNIKAIHETGIWDCYAKTMMVKKSAFSFRILNKKTEIESAADELIDKLPIKIDDSVRPFLISAIIEVFNNAFEHGKDVSGIFSAGNFDSNKRHFVFLYMTMELESDIMLKNF